MKTARWRQRRLHQWHCHERLVIAEALAEVQHQTLLGARIPRERSRPFTVPEDCQRDTMILVSKTGRSSFLHLSLRPWSRLSLSSVVTCHLHKVVEENRDSSVLQFPVDLPMHVDILQGRVSECSAQVLFTTPRNQKPFVEARSIFRRGRVQQFLGETDHRRSSSPNVWGNRPGHSPAVRGRSHYVAGGGGAHVSDLGGV